MMKQKLKQNRINWLVLALVGTIGLSLLLPQGAAAAGTVSSIYSRISVDSSSVKAGASGATITIHLRDDEENLLEGQRENIALTSSRGTDDTIGDIREAGSGVYTATITSTTAGTATVTAKVGDTIIGTAGVTFSAGDADSSQSTVEVDSSLVKIDGSSGTAITVTLKDSYGNIISGESDLALSSSRGTADTIGSIRESGSGVYTATITSTTAGTATVMAKVGDTIIGTAGVTFSAGDADSSQSTVEVDSSLVKIDGSSGTAITVTLKDSYGNIISSEGDLILSSSRGTAIDTIGSISNEGSGVYTATITSTTAGTATVTAEVGSATISTASVTFTAGDASSAQSTVAVDSSLVKIDGSSGTTITVTLKDSYGNVISDEGDLILSSSRGTAIDTIGSISNEGSGVYTATITSTTAGTATVTAEVGSATIGTATVIFTAGDASADKSTLTVDSSSITANGSSTATVTVQLIDVYGNTLTSQSDKTVEINCTGGTIGATGYTTGGQYQATITSSTTAGGPYTISATLDGSAIEATQTITFTPGAASTSMSTLTVDSSSIIANGANTATVTVQLIDAYGNNITSQSAQTIKINCTGGTIGNTSYTTGGQYQATITSSTTAGGPYTISATLDGSAISATKTISFVPGPVSAATSTISVALSSIPVGGTSTTVTVRLIDKDGNYLNSGGDTVTIEASDGIVGTVTDKSNGTYTASLTSSTTSGTVTVSAKISSGYLDKTATIIFAEGGASTNTSMITAADSSLTADGTSKTKITIQLKDSYGNLLADGGGVSVTMEADPCGTIVSPATDNGNGTYTTYLTSSTTAGTVTVSGKINGVSISNTATVYFVAGAASTATSTITAADSSLVVGGGTTTITIQLKDQYGNSLTTNSAGDSVTLTTDLGTIDAWATYQKDGYFIATLTSGNAVGTATIYGALVVGGVPTTMSKIATVNYVAGVASATTSTVSAAPSSIQVGGSSMVITVQLKDKYGNSLTSSGGTVTMSTDLGTLSAVTNQGNGTYTATLTSGTTSGIATVSAYLGGTQFTDSTSGSAAVTFSPSIAVKSTSTITAAESSLTADGSTTTVTVQLKDMYGNNLTNNDAGNAVTLSTSRGSIGTATYQKDGYFTATLKAATSTGTAIITGYLNSTEMIDTETVIFTPGPAVAGMSVVSASPTSVEVGGHQTTLTVQLKDQYGNKLTTGTGIVSLTASLGGSTTSAGTIGEITNKGDGTYTATYSSAETIGTVTISGTLAGDAIGADATITLTPSTASTATSTISAGHTSISDGGASTKITVQLKDQYGNNLESSGGTITLEASDGTLSTVIDNGDGTYVATLTSSTTAGVITVSGKLGGVAFDDTASVDVSIGVASAVTSTIAATSNSVSTDGASTTITVKLMDIYGNALTTGGNTVTLTTSSGTITTVIDQGNGTYTATLTAGTTALETVTITGMLMVDGTMVTMDHTATVSFAPGAASGDTSTITAVTSSAAVGGNTLELTIQLRDQHSNELWSSSDSVTLTPSSGTIQSVINNSDGTFTAVLKSSTTAGSVTISGIINTSLAITDTETVTFTPGAAYAAKSTISASPVSIQVGGKNSAITVQLYDEYGNKLIAGGDTVELSTTGGSLSHVSDQNNGTYTATLTSLTTSGTFTVSGTVTASGPTTMSAIGTSATVTFTAADPTASSSTVSAADSSITADGTSTTTITVQLKDQYGNNLTFSGGTVTMTTTAGTLSTVTDKEDGSYTAILTSSTHLETATIYASFNGTLINRSVTVEFTVGNSSTTTSLITASPYWIKADGSTTSTITVQLRDAQGHYLTSNGGTVTLTTTAGTLSSDTMTYNSSTQTYTATITSSTTSGTATIHGFIDGAEMTNSTTVTFYGEGGSSVTILLSASPTSITADGTSTSTITAQYGTTGGNTVTLTTNAGTLSSVTDKGDGSYTATLTASTAVETATIGMKVGGVFYSNTATVEFVAGEASADTSLITADKTSITANGSASTTITVELRDAYGNAATTSGTVALSATLGSLGAVTTNADGTYSAVLTAGTKSGTAVVSGTITLGGGTVINLSNTATVYFTPGAVSTSTSRITAATSSIQAGGANTTITVQLKDAYGNNLTSSAGTVYLSVSDGSLSTVVDKSNGTYISTLTSASKVETVTISGSILVTGDSSTTALSDTEAVEYTVGPASVNTTTITPAKTSISAGSGSTTITIQLVDAYGNLLSTDGAIVTLKTTLGSISTPAYSENGQYTATLTSASTVGTATISGTLTLSGGSPETIAATATVKLVPATASAVTSTISVDKTSVIVGGSIATITVKLKDEYGNDLTSGGDAVTFTPTDWTVQGNTINDAGNGTYTAVLVSSETAGIVTIEGYINGTAMTNTAAIKFLPGAADKDKSTITAAASSLTVGGSSTVITVKLIDQYNNKLTSNGGTVTLTQSEGAASSLSAVTDKGDGTYTATLTSSTTVGSTIISGTVTPTGTTDALTIANTATVAFTIGTPSVKTSTISASPASLTAGSSGAATIIVQLADQFGNLWTTSGINSSSSKVTVTISASSGTVGTVTDVGDGTYIAQLTPSTVAGTVTIYGKIDGTQMINTATVTFSPGAASPPKAVISGSPSSIISDGTSVSTITVQLRDQYSNNLTSNDADNKVVLSTSLGTISAATYQKSGYFTATLTSSTVTGTATITGTLNGTTMSDSDTVSFTPGTVAAANATITAAASSIQVGGSTTKVTVQLKDQYGNNLTASAGTVVLSTTLGAISAAVDQLDGTYIATLTSATMVGTAVISGTLDSGSGVETISDTETVSFTAGNATAIKSVILASPTTITADGSSTSTITVQLIDSYGNYLSDKTGVSSITLSTTLGAITTPVYQNNGTYRAVVTSATSAGTATVSGTINGTTMTNTVTLSFVAGAASGGYSTISASPTELKADGTSTSTITVQLKDQYGNKLTDSRDYTVDLTETIGTSNVSVTATNKNDGTFTATITAPTTVGIATISGNLSGTSITTQSITNTATIKFITGSAVVATSTITGSPSSITANGTSTSTITVQLKDAYGNDLTTSGGTVTLTQSAGSLTTVKDNSNGTYTATLTSTTTAQTVTISGKLNGTAMTNSGTVYFVPGEASVAKSTISVSPSSVTADGSTAATISVKLKDAYGNLLTKATDIIVLTSSRGSSDTITEASYSNGVYKATITSTLTGSATISATINGSSITSGNATVTFTPGAVNLAQSTLTVSPTSVTADGSTTATISIQLKDAYGNTLTSTSNTVTVISSRGTSDTITQSSYASGVYKATIKSTLTGTATISGTVNGSAITSGDATVTFTPGTASAVKSTISVSPSSVKIDGTTAAVITVQLKDAYGNNLTASGDTVTLTSSRGSSDTIGTVTYSSDGAYTATILSTVAGTATISGKVNSAAITTGNATVAFTSGTASAAKSTISVSPSSVKIDGTTTATITVQVKDAYGNNLDASGDAVTLTSSRGSSDTIGTVTYATGGAYTATILSTVAGTATISGTVNGTSITSGNATVTFTPGTASAVKSTISVSPGSVQIDGTTKATITVQLRDAYGNNLAASGDTVTLTSSRGSNDTIGTITYTTGGAYIATILSTVAGMATVSGTVNGTSITSGNATVTFTPGTASAVKSTITIDNSTITANGTSTATVTVQLADAYGNALSVSGGTVKISCASAVSNGASVSNTGDLGNGKYQAVITSSTLAGGPYTVNATLDGTAFTATTVVSFAPDAAVIGKSTIAAAPTSITADGSSTATAIVQLIDTYGNKLTSSGGVVEISCEAGTIGATTNNFDGTYQATITSSTKVGTYKVSATLAGVPLSATTTITFVPGAAVADNSIITIAKEAIIADGKSTTTVTVQLVDANDNKLTTDGGTVKIACPDAVTNGAAVSDTSYVGSGQYQAVITASASISGPYAISASLDGSAIMTSTTVSVSFVAGTVTISTKISGNQLIVQVDNTAYTGTELIIDSGTAVDQTANTQGVTTFTLPTDTGIYTLKIRVYYQLTDGSYRYSDPVVVFYAVRPKYIPGKGDGFGWEMWK